MSGLQSPVHELLVLNYLRFYRDRLSSHVSEVNGLVDDARDMRLIKPLYDKDELQEEIDILKDLVSNNFKDHLEKYTEQTLHFVKQLMLQAEGQDVDVSVRPADLENGNWLEDMASLDLEKEVKHSGPSAKTGDAKLHMKINELTEESNRTENRLDKLEVQLRGTEKDNDDMEADIKDLRRTLEDLQDRTLDLPGSTMSKKVMALRGELDDLKKNNNAALGPLRNEVSDYREELATKVAECSQFKSLLKMTQQKNKLLRDLRDGVQ